MTSYQSELHTVSHPRKIPKKGRRSSAHGHALTELPPDPMTDGINHERVERGCIGVVNGRIISVGRLELSAALHSHLKDD